MKRLLVLVVLLYTTTSVNGCASLTAATGQFWSPDYYNNGYYPADTDCTWLITVAMDHTVGLTFLHYALEGCPYDYVTIYDGPTNTHAVLAQFCTPIGVPHTVRSSGNTMTIHMVSDSWFNEIGFLAEYESEQITGCRGTFTSRNGTITSPSYPNEYLFMLTCVWHIVVEAGYNISLSFTDLDMENSQLCIYDNVILYDGPDETYPVFGKYCGSELPAASLPVASGNTVTIQMSSDARVSGRGFAIDYDSTNSSSIPVELEPMGPTIPENSATGLSYEVAMVILLLVCHVAMLAL